MHLKAENNVLHWDIFEIQEAELEQLKKLLGEGYSIRDCAEEMGLSKSTVHRLKKKLDME